MLESQICHRAQLRVANMVMTLNEADEFTTTEYAGLDSSIVHNHGWRRDGLGRSGQGLLAADMACFDTPLAPLSDR